MSVALLNVGFNWDIDLAHQLVSANNLLGPPNKTRIASVYGSVVSNPFGTARPKSRLKNVSKEDQYECSKVLRAGGIELNYTLNISDLGDLRWFEKGERAQIEFLGFLYNVLGVKMLTIAHPLVLERVIKSKIPFEIEISTIMNVDTLGHFDLYKKTSSQIKRICLAIGRNRDISFLQKIGRLDKSFPICELLANEFCTVAGHNCAGVFRSSCYSCHSHNVGNDMFNNYPMGRCTKSRWNNPSSWLKARFILPQWMNIYQDLGINHFKVSGRTHPSEYIIEMAKAYLTRYYGGNLLGLWAQLETIWDGFDKQEEIIKELPINLDCSTPKMNNFIRRWFANPKFRCSEMLCGVECTKCESDYEEIINDSGKGISQISSQLVGTKSSRLRRKK